MRKILLLGTALALALTSTAWAGAKDKSSNTLMDKDGAGLFSNTLAKTKVKSKGCTTQVQVKPIAMADGELAICVLEADVVGIGGNSLIITGEAKKLQLKAKVDLGEAKFALAGCGDLEALSYNGQIVCYTDDILYRSNATGAGTWRDACTAAGMLPGDGPGATMNKANPGVPKVIGLCQGFAEGDRIDPPSSGVEWGRTGQRTAVE